jgi:phage FluMu protein Com
MLFSGKLNKLRNIAMLICFFGIGVMYIGYAGFSGYLGSSFNHSMTFMSVFLALGIFFIMGSTVFYMYIGMLSSKALRVECPKCKRVTKMVGKVDDCMYCRQTLSIDPKHAPKKEDLTEAKL